MCPFAQRVWILLEELQIPYVKTHIDLRDKPTWFTEEINPAGKVPAVRDQSGAVLVESLDIVDSLAAGHPAASARSLRGSSPEAREAVARWNGHVEESLNPAFFTYLMHKGPAGDAADVEKRAALDGALAVYERELKGPFLCGEDFTLADLVAAPFFERLMVTLPHFRRTDPLADCPRVRDWIARVLARPSVAKTLRPEDQLLNVYAKFVSSDYSFGGLSRQGEGEKI